MNQFAQYFIAFIKIWWEQFKLFFKNMGVAFQKGFATKAFFENITYYSPEFGVLGWLMFVFMTLVILAFVTCLVIKIGQLLVRFFRFRSIEVEKEELLSEIANLNKQVKTLDLEKQTILSLKVGTLAGAGGNLDVLTGGLVDMNEFSQYSSDSGMPSNYNNYNASNVNTNKGGATPSRTSSKTEAELVEEGSEKRFTKLVAVDDKYADGSYIVNMKEEDMLSLKNIVDRFINFAASQMHLYYSKTVISRFFAGMATGKLIILEGISGTGKTSLPYAMSKFFKNDASIVPVQPSWRDKSEIIGYLNEFTKKFNETDFLKALYEVTYREDVNYIVLDEMNLARIEYYFAEFLSMMEMPDVSEWKIDLTPSSQPDDPRHLSNGKILVPQNVWFIGTANKDDSTFTITDKVYDRATTIILNAKADFIDAPFTESLDLSYDYLNQLFLKARTEFSISPKTLEDFKKLDYFIQDNFKIAFGNRIMRQINTFVPVYMACGFSEYAGLDYMLATKILRKFESLNLAFLKKEIDELIALLNKMFGKDSFKESIAYLKDLQRMN